MLLSCCAVRSVTLINLTARLTTPADSTLKSDWLEQLQVQEDANGYDVDNKLHTATQARTQKQEQMGHARTYPVHTYSVRTHIHPPV